MRHSKFQPLSGRHRSCFASAGERLSVSIAAAIPNSMMSEYVPQMEPVLKRRVRIEDGYAIPSDAPGHGIEFDEKAMTKFEVK